MDGADLFPAAPCGITNVMQVSASDTLKSGSDSDNELPLAVVASAEDTAAVNVIDGLDTVGGDIVDLTFLLDSALEPPPIPSAVAEVIGLASEGFEQEIGGSVGGAEAVPASSFVNEPGFRILYDDDLAFHHANPAL
jgi:hypothetical protein